MENNIVDRSGEQAQGARDEHMEDTILRAQALIYEQKYDEALELLAPLDDKSDYGGLIRFIRGNIYIALEREEDAMCEYDEALRSGFIHADILMNLAVLKLREGKPDQAEKLFFQAADLDKEDMVPYSRVVMLRLDLGDLDGAAALMDEMTNRFPEHFSGFHHKAELLMAKGMPQSALDLLDGVAGRFSADPMYVCDRSRALRMLDRCEEALGYLDERMFVFRDEIAIILSKQERARLLQKIGDIDAAAPILTELYEHYGDRESGYALVGEALSKADFSTVIRLTEEMSSAPVRDNFYYMSMYFKALALKMSADTLKARKGYEEALEAFESLESEGGDISLLIFRASIQQELGLFQQALDTLSLLDDFASDIEPYHPEKAKTVREQLGELRDVITADVNANGPVSAAIATETTADKTAAITTESVTSANGFS